jgi:rubredoxin
MPVTTTGGSPSLPPYSGDETYCPKCGWNPASVAYVKFGHCHHNIGPQQSLVEGYEVNERLHRECHSCGYAWDEAILPTTSKE